MRVLYIEDNYINRLVMEKSIESICTIECAENGPEGIQKASSGSYDVILIDINLNDPAMDGIAVLKKLKHELKLSSYYMAVTAYTDHQLEQKCLALGFDKFINKPIDFAEFKKTILDGEPA